MLLLGRIRQHRCACPIIITCLLGNLMFLVFYLRPHTKSLEVNPDDLKDDNGIPLFLHEPLENDNHRNSLKHPHQVRMKLSFRMNDNLKHLVSTHAQSAEADTEIKERPVLEVQKRDIRHKRKDVRGDRVEGQQYRPGGKQNQINGLFLDELTDNAREVIRVNNQQVIPLTLLQTQPPKVAMMSTRDPSLAVGDTHDYGQFSRREFVQAGGRQEAIHVDEIRVLFSPVTMCEENREVYLLIAVVSDIRRYKLRNAIRETWGRGAASGRFATQLVFVIGRPQQKDSPLSKMIVAENQQFGDILYLDIEESHTILTYKTLAMFQWTLEYCNQAKYILKTDDDVFINIPNILRDLKIMEGSKPTRFMLGHVIEGAKPTTDRHDKWFMPGGQFKGKRFPTYLSGSAYVLPSTLLEPIMQASRETTTFWLEDIYITGILAQNIKATLIHNSKFEFGKRKLGPCRFKKLNSAHNLSPDDLVFVWREFNRGSLRCVNTDAHFSPILDYDPE